MAVAILAVAAAWFFSSRRDASLSRLRDRGVIRIGYAAEPPFVVLKQAGEVTGESPEVAKRVVASLGINRIEWRQTEFGTLIDGLEAGRFDAIAAGMFITPERARRVRFSEPTFHVSQALLVAKGNPRGLHSYHQAMVSKDVRIATLYGAVEEGLLLRMGLSAARLVSVPDALAGRVAVESGLADGLALSAPAVRWMAMQEQLGKTEMAQPFEQPEEAARGRLGFGAFAFRADDRELLLAWNRVLAGFVGSPEHRQLVGSFGFTAEDMPGDTSTAEILATP